MLLGFVPHPNVLLMANWGRQVIKKKEGMPSSPPFNLFAPVKPL